MASGQVDATRCEFGMNFPDLLVQLGFVGVFRYPIQWKIVS